jgi:DNA polymerase elongation subunit (family B)
VRENNTEASRFRRIVVLDIETVSLDPANGKGALDALSGRIVCIGLLFDDGQHTSELALTDIDERRILEKFWDVIEPTDVLVGHNILDFDLPFILQRSWIHNIRPTRTIDMRKYYTGEVIDTMQVWSNWSYKKAVKLDELAQALGVGQKSGKGTDVAHWWAVRDFDSIKRYCLDDVRLTYRVFCRLKYLPTRGAADRAELPVSA